MFYVTRYHRGCTFSRHLDPVLSVRAPWESIGICTSGYLATLHVFVYLHEKLKDLEVVLRQKLVITVQFLLLSLKVELGPEWCATALFCAARGRQK